MTMEQKPLMLKDFLELDWDSEPSGAGFRCALRRPDDARSVRRLLEAEVRSGGGGRRLPRTRSMSALKRISSVLRAVGRLPFSDSPSPASGGGILSRSFSRRMSVSFWRKRAKSEAAKEEELRTLDDDVLRRSCDLPSLAVSRCSSWSSESEYCSFRPRLVSSSSTSSADDDASEDSGGKEGRTAGGGEVSDEASAKAAEREGKESPECHSTASEEEKEQLSPVSVMDFPSEEEDDDDDDGEAGDRPSNSFRHTLAKLERRKLHLLHKIGRFETLTVLDPVNLDRHFAACHQDDRSSDTVHRREEEVHEDERESVRSTRKAWGLLQQLSAVCHVGALDESVEKLLVDFFIDELSLSRSDDGGDVGCRRRLQGAEGEQEEEALLRRARDWVEGLAEDCDGDETLRDMDGEGWRRCRSVEIEAEVAVDLEGLLLRSLVAELVVDLASR